MARSVRTVASTLFVTLSLTAAAPAHGPLPPMDDAVRAGPVVEPPPRSQVRLRPLPEDFVVRDRQQYGSLQEALRNGQLDFARRNGTELSSLQSRLVQGLSQALDGRVRGARATLESLAFDARDAGDSALAQLSDAAGINLRFEAADYDGVMAAVGADASDGLVAGLAELPRQTLGAGEPVSDRLRPGPGGQAALTVAVNGRIAEWWFDTGASFSVVSRSAARAWGVRVVPDPGPVGVATATSRSASARLGVVERLQVGEVVARNVPVVVMEDEDLVFERDDGTTASVDGILGWTVIRSLRTELDFPADRYTARLSSPSPEGDRNLGWLGYPIVRLADGRGQPLLFGLDTGSRNTSITRNILAKSDLGAVRRDTVRIPGIGGSVREPVWIGDTLALAFPHALATLADVRTEPASGADDVIFFDVDGVLGVDVAQGGILIVDPPKGIVHLHPSGG
ncbi:MAG: aspartyl protease family protein [Gemmatimonadota bacterium]